MCTMVVPSYPFRYCVPRDGSPYCIAVYIPSAREIVELNMAAIIDKGGVWNTSCLFLKNACNVVVVNSTTGVTRKGVMKIMRQKVSDETLFMLDACV